MWIHILGGGRSEYPASCWYSYDDVTCTYGCQKTECSSSGLIQLPTGRIIQGTAFVSLYRKLAYKVFLSPGAGLRGGCERGAQVPLLAADVVPWRPGRAGPRGRCEAGLVLPSAAV